MLPLEIETLIHEYRIQFERVDSDIQDAINHYHTIETRVSQLLCEVEEMGLCHYHVKNLQNALHSTVHQSSRIVSDILENEEIHMVQTEMLEALNNEILYNIFNILLHPFYIPGNLLNDN